MLKLIISLTGHQASSYSNQSTLQYQLRNKYKQSNKKGKTKQRINSNKTPKMNRFKYKTKLSE
jgi:hypothetical protein